MDKVHAVKGLTSEQAHERLEKYGKNTFEKENSKPALIFFRQFLNPLTFILIFAAGLSFFLKEYPDSIVIAVIIIINCFLSFIQEYRSAKAVEKLSKLVERSVTVIRNGMKSVINTIELVPGDVIILRNGDIVPADAEVVESNDLLVNESQLSGESVPLDKAAGDKVFAGSVIEKGLCKCTVYATGKLTELGKIAKLSRETHTATPIAKSLSAFSFTLLKIIGATIVLLISIKAFTMSPGESFGETLLFIIALAMTSVPEALPMITTITLSSGAIALGKQKVIVKRLSGVEALGRINLLCTDKTGTLTEDILQVVGTVSDNPNLLSKFFYASIEDKNLTDSKHINSFDKAILNFVPDEIKKESEKLKNIRVIPFEPAERRRRIVICDEAENKYYFIVVGALEILLKLCEVKDYSSYENVISESQNNGVRQLALAYKEIEYKDGLEVFPTEDNLILLGSVSMADPLRKSAKESILQAGALGVGVKILTGDSREVAYYIGRQVGLLAEGEKVFTGEELIKLSEAELGSVLEKHSVFARVTPAQKYSIVKSLKTCYVVGYLGDGINDAPSLKVADVGVAVHNATDVAKNSADIILTEDGLDVIINGIKLGRSVFVNIGKYIKHAMIGNLGNFFSLIFFYLVFAADIPMLAIQLLIANLIQDMPLLTVFSDNVEPEIIAKPQTADKFKSLIVTFMPLGFVAAVYYLLFFLYTGTTTTPLTQSILFLFYNITQILVIVSIRTERGYLWQGSFPSKLLLSSILFFIGLSVAIIYIPFIASFMGLTAVPIGDFAVLLAFAVSFIFLLDFCKVQIYKFGQRTRDRTLQR